MKILFILELYYPNIGGNERLFKSLAESLASQGHQVSILTTRFSKDLPEKEEINAVLIKRLPVLNRFCFTLFATCPAIRLAKKADLIHTTSYNAAFPAWIAAKVRKKKVIITFHEAWGKLWFRLPYMNSLQRRLYYYFEQFILGLKFDKFIAVSDYTKDCLLQNKVRPDRIIRIYNGLDYKQFKGLTHKPPEHFTFTYFGRPGNSKGLDILMEAAPEFIRKHPKAILKLIISKSPLNIYRKIIETIDQYKLNDNTIILSGLDDKTLKDELLNSSCIVIPSYSEGFCYAAAETIALGVPLVHSNLGALKEVVSGNNIPMKSHDTQGLLDALEKAITGLWMEAPVRKFELQNTVNEYLKLYESSLS
ncbi:MAG: glycosyltransferase family 4 protein [Bacteroidota bacterium]|nr:glycosyltransferase family 4 protein [Bacteroidota bacterium]